MKDKMYQMYLDRAKLFFKRSMNELFFETQPLTAEFSPSKEPVYFQDRLKGKYRAIKEGDPWGETWGSAWFHVTGSIPKSWAQQPVALWCDFNGEALIFDATGMPLFSLTDSSVFASNYCKPFYQLPFKVKGGEKLDYWIETAANGLFGLDMDGDPAANCPKPYGDRQGILKTLKMGHFNLDLWHLRLDFEVLLGLVEALPAGDYRALRTIDAMNEAVNVYAENPANAKAARQPLRRILDLPAMASAMTVTAVGHAHIDTGWLWPVRESIRKCARTFASQVHNIEKYPGYVFGASSPQHYAFTKQHYPELYRKIKKYVKDGRWELQGGMWVEADCNITSGESLVRQFLHGKNFYMDEFGVDVDNLWIPDVFGYSAAMPQIIKKSGCNFFLTQKISWSQFNKFPYHTFMWRGIDGTEVLTHFPPEDTYNADLNPNQLAPAQNKFKENTILNEFMSLFGIGDGGGGPKEEYIERGLRVANLEGCPKVKFGRACDYFARLLKYAPQLPKWVGELYLELHRGTLTTQSRTKRGNRKVEQALAATEFICSCLPLNQYPAKELDGLWKTLLLNQFHDILPGSSIGKVYEVTQQEHAEILAGCDKLMAQAAKKLFAADAKSAVVVNTISAPAHAAVELPASWKGKSVTADGKKVATQDENGKTVALLDLPGSSIVTLKQAAGKPVAAAAKKNQKLVLENDLVKYEFAANGEIVSAYDKEAGRNILKPGTVGNQLSLYIDHPNNWDAWDVDFFYTDELVEHARPVKAAKVVDGPVRQVLEFELAIGSSTLKQRAVLTARGKRVDFQTEVDWHEMRKMLRVAFSAEVFATEAVFDIQYGFARRATHRNTSWDFAKFEVPAQRYVDISENSYGVALLNDCKYGHKAADTTLDLCLLRSPKYPDWDADQGQQVFTYSLLPHRNRLEESGVMAEAALVNRAPYLFAGLKSAVTPPVRLESADIGLEIVKKAEKENVLVIRLVELKGRTSSGVLHLQPGYGKLAETNLLEWTAGENVKVGGNRQVAVTLKPFEIRTYKVLKG